MDFLKRVLSTVVGVFIFFLLSILFLLFIGVALSKSGSKSTKLTKDTVLELKLDFPIQDNSGKIRYADLPFLNQDSKDGLFDLINAIDYAAEDNHIKGITIEKPTTQAGITQLKTIREALERFKESGKFVTAYADVLTQNDYYLASVADTVVMSPVGMLDFKGLATQLLYLKNIQEKTGVKMDVIRMGKYKSAVEPFLENEISEANEEQILSYLNSIWGSLKDEIGESRNISPERLDSIAENLLARTPDRALEVGLIDKIDYFGEYEDGLKKALNVKDKKKLNRISLRKYADEVAPAKVPKSSSDKIAVIYAQGEIIYGPGSVDKIGPEEINKSLRKAQEDDNIKAVVLRVNSPGGSALSSDLIWKEIENTKKVKPVIVSMGDLAASGGYYISAGADRIFAEPSTITGSIGVFGVLPNIKELSDKVGINAQQVTTNKNAITYTPFKDLTEPQRELILENISSIYDLFKSRVSEGRDLSMDEVEELAQGRVWTGEQALDNGLVDELGGLDKALEYAAGKADLKDYEIQEFPIFELEFDKLFRQYSRFIKTENEIIKEAVGEELYPALEEVRNNMNRKGIQLIFPYSTQIN